MSPDEIDRLTKEVDSLIGRIDKALRHRVTIESHDNGDDGDDDYGDLNVSNPSDAVDHSDDNDGDPNDDDDDGDETADDEDEEELVAKGFYPSAREAGYQQSRSRADRPGGLKHSSHRDNSPIVGSRNFEGDVTPVVQPPPRTKFDAVVDRIVAEEGMNRMGAMVEARRRHPNLYTAHQSSIAGSTTQQQHYDRSDMRGSYFKAAPGTAESLIAAEMKKGLSYECASQRVAQAHGYRAWDRRDRIAKRADDIAESFEAVADQVWCDNDVDRTQALRIVRKARPKLFRAMQRS
jgi:hypothetical protein